MSKDKPKEKTVVKSFIGEDWIKVQLNKATKVNDYMVSNYGRIKSIFRKNGNEKLLKGTIEKRGFRTLNVRLVEGHQTVFIHKVVAENFVNQPSPKHEYVAHLDFNKQNNFHKNLVWLDEAGWTEYQQKREEEYNKSAFPSDYKSEVTSPNINSKLTESQVALIKKRLLKGKTKPKIIAKQFGVSLTQVKRIEKRENWKHVKPAI